MVLHTTAMFKKYIDVHGWGIPGVCIVLEHSQNISWIQIGDWLFLPIASVQD